MAVHDQREDDVLDEAIELTGRVEEFLKGNKIVVSGEDAPPRDFEVSLERLSGVYIGFANCLSSYRRKLEENGVPQEEAAVLTRDANWIWLCRCSFPEETPIPPSCFPGE